MKKKLLSLGLVPLSLVPLGIVSSCTITEMGLNEFPEAINAKRDELTMLLTETMGKQLTLETITPLVRDAIKKQEGFTTEKQVDDFIVDRQINEMGIETPLGTAYLYNKGDVSTIIEKFIGVFDYKLEKEYSFESVYSFSFKKPLTIALFRNHSGKVASFNINLEGQWFILKSKL